MVSISASSSISATNVLVDLLEPCIGTSLAWIVASLVGAVIILMILIVPIASVAVYAERKIASFIQCRLGPTEVGPGNYDDLPTHLLPFGIGKILVLLIKALGFVLSLVLIPFIFIGTGKVRVGMPPGWYGLGTMVSDAIKLLAKEDIMPEKSDPALFRLAPYIVFAATLSAFAVVPFGISPSGIPLMVARLDAGILYLLAASSVGIIGMVIGGYASNNKWSLYGSMRIVAQAISYEVPMGLALLAVVMVTGSFDLVDIAESQKGDPNSATYGLFLHWNIFSNPFLFVSAIIYAIAAVAETNRTPFDLAEAESELVSGFNTEYSGMRFALFSLAEYANMLLAGLVGALFFLGGYATGIPGLDAIYILGPIVLLSKAFVFLLFVIMLRWTLPRYRVDRLMTMCWKGLIPLALFAFLGAGFFVALISVVSNPMLFKFGGSILVFAIVAIYGITVSKGLAPVPIRKKTGGTA
ncbi:MAG: NADH-quinone oxidoreductase subunit H [Candidatus Lindowbacteria bacterium]|nr:NADH-quinone oxidoreductase subunit H [Candidatus Lindowbacteria bacterium]